MPAPFLMKPFALLLETFWDFHVSVEPVPTVYVRTATVALLRVPPCVTVTV